MLYTTDTHHQVQRKALAEGHTKTEQRLRDALSALARDRADVDSKLAAAVERSRAVQAADAALQRRTAELAARESTATDTATVSARALQQERTELVSVQQDVTRLKAEVCYCSTGIVHTELMICTVCESDA
jgi:chromosome segregation ATPase